MLPYSLDLLSDLLPEIHIPADPFDPNGSWEHNYIVANPARAKKAKSERSGNLQVRRRLTADGNAHLQVTQIIKMRPPNGSGRSKAAITCAVDELATPVRWTLDSEVLDSEDKQVPYTADSISGRMADGKAILTREKESQLTVSGRFSSNWSLLDAVQRLPFDSGQFEFTMLDELELLKPDQLLFPGDTAEVTLGGRKMKLHSFEHLGQGILPFTYWLDDQHRLVVAVSQRRAYLCSSAAEGSGGAR